MASSPSKIAIPISIALFSMTAAILLADKPLASDDGCSSASQSSSKVAKPGIPVLMMGGFPLSTADSSALKCPHLLFLDKGSRQDMSSIGAAENAVLQSQILAWTCGSHHQVSKEFQTQTSFTLCKHLLLFLK